MVTLIKRHTNKDDIELFRVFIEHPSYINAINMDMNILKINKNATLVFSISFQQGRLNQNVAFIRQLYKFVIVSSRNSTKFH